MSIAITLFVLALVAICFCSVANSVVDTFEDNVNPVVRKAVSKALGVLAQVSIATATVALFAEVVVQLL